MNEQISRYIFFAGVFLVIFGAVMMRFPGMLGWFGKLPGDIKIQNDKLSLYIPITSMVLISLGLSLGAHLVGRIFFSK